MTRAKPNRTARRASAAGSSRLDAARFPALVAFFRGYLHQDVLEEHGSAAAAARAFMREASAGEAEAAASEWAAFAREADALPLAEVRRAMVERMGSAWAPLARRELVALGRALAGR